MHIYTKATKQSFLYNDKQAFYWVVGNAKNPVIVMLPGYTGVHSNLLGISSKLREDYFVIIPDYPGWGQSLPFNHKQLTIHNYAVFLNSLLDHVEIKKIFLLGHCMGSIIAIDFTKHFPRYVQQLFLVSPPYEDGQLNKKIFLHLAEMSVHVPKRLRPIFFL